MANLQDAFIEIIYYYGFTISKQLVSKLEAVGKQKYDTFVPAFCEQHNRIPNYTFI